MDKVEIFRNYINPTIKFTGKIINVNYNTSTALFWIQSPPHIKSILTKHRLKPNSFHFNDLIDKKYIPRIGDYISCNYIIDRCDNLFFINIELDKLSKHTKTSTKRTNKSGASASTKRTNKSGASASTKRTNKSGTSTSTKRTNKSGASASKCVSNPYKSHSQNTRKIRVFIINGHSFECELKDVNKDIANFLIYNRLKELYDSHSGYMDDLPLTIIKMLEKEKNKNYIFYINLKKNIETMKNGDKVKCHNHKSIYATHICNDCLSRNELYFFCEDCIQRHHKHHSIEKLNYRINLRTDFKSESPKSNIKYMAGQSTGRVGFLSTSYSIMNNMQNIPKFRELIYRAKNKEDMKKLDKELNYLNTFFPSGLHTDKLDSNFAIYPRKNKERIITGPKNKLISFFPVTTPDEPNTYTNGAGWPIGIFELPIFNINDTETYKDKYGVINNLSSYKYDKLFNNNLYNEKKSYIPEWEFYSNFKSTDPITIIKKALMLELMDKSIPKRKRVISKTEIGLIKKWGEEIAELTKFNKYIFDTMMKKNNVHIDIPLDELIRNTLRIANIKPDEDVIFISNECRLIHYPNKPINQKNQTMNSTTGPSVQILRDESRN